MKKWLRMALVLCLGATACSGGRYAPEVAPLSEPEQRTRVDQVLAPGADTAGLVVHGGEVRQAEFGLDALLDGLPDPAPGAGDAYQPPLPFEPIKAGHKHFFGFTASEDFARANQTFMRGDLDGVMKWTGAIMEDKGADPAEAWQASALRVMALLAMGRADLAEAETARTEALETRAMGMNLGSRALRAEARMWAGDAEGAVRDAAQVVRALGSWRFSTSYALPPSDLPRLGDTASAQIRAEIVLGMALMDAGRNRQALAWLARADQDMNAAMAVAAHPVYGMFFSVFQDMYHGRGMVLAAMAEAETGLDPDSPEALTHLSRADEHFKAIGYKAGRVLGLLFRTRALAGHQRWQEVLDTARAGRDMAVQYGLPGLAWPMLAYQGMALAHLGNRGGAEKALRRAQAEADLLAGSLASDRDKRLFARNSWLVAKGLAELDRDKGDLDALFADLEQGRARSFVAMLADRAVASGRQPELAGRIRALDKKIIQARQAGEALAPEGGTTTDTAALQAKRASLVQELAARDRDLAEALGVAVANLGLVRRALEPGQSLAYALPGEGTEPVRLLVIDRHGARLEKTGLDWQGLGKLLDGFARASGRESGTRGVAIRATGPDKAEQARVADELGKGLGITRWTGESGTYVVPSGRLYFVPWGALDVSAPVSVLPTAGFVIREAGPAGAAGAVVVGDPEFGGLAAQLPGARAEAVAVADQYGESPLLGPQATPDALRAEVGQGTGVLHLATHALFDPGRPLKSALILSNGNKAVALTAEDIYAAPLPARVAALSACETGLGRVAAGDDLVGLARSFYLGGAVNVLSSLWPVEDEPTRMFMQTFHALLPTKGAGQAWLAARNQLKQADYPPSTYGAFTLGGRLAE